VAVRFSGVGVANLPLEEYVAAVLAAESGGFRSEEALKAMAVATRTYALHFRGRHREQGFDFCDTTHCQDLRRSKVTPRLRQAAGATAGEMVWYSGSPAAAYYHAHCGGSTEAPQYVWGVREPYLRQRADRYCAREGAKEWHSEYSKGLIERVLEDQGVETPHRLDSVQVVQRTPSGRAARLLLSGSEMAVVKIADFRRAIQRGLGWKSVPSDSFSVREGSGTFVFSGKGFGHAVGLCQAGAERMGEEGKPYREILAYYYPGTVLAR
jgi:stage II sporulation protein D